MNLPSLLHELSSQGVKLSVQDESLVVQAPKGRLTPQHHQALAKHKKQLLLLLEHNRSGEAATRTFPALIPAPAERHTPFPMTDMQHAFWVGRSGGLELGGVANHGYYEIEQETLDVVRLNGALQRLIERHDMLRAVVLPDGQQQVLADVPPYEMQILDLRGQAEESVFSQLIEIREHLSHQVLPTDQYPLFEFRATHWRDPKKGDRTRLHISYDLQIFDAWSLFRLFDEWFQFYTRPDLTLPPLALSFRDYVLAEQALENTDLYRQSQAYWHQHIDTLPPAPELPLARHPQELQQHRCRRYEKQLTPASWQQLKQHAAQAGLTPSGVLLAAFADILSLWNKTPRFTLNVALFNRLPLHPQVNDILGDFSSVTLLAVDHTAVGTLPSNFKSRAKQLQKQLWRDLDHRYMSGVKVVRELSRRKGHLPSAMPVVFTSTLGFGGIGQETLTFSHFGERVYGISQASQTWMDIQVWEEKGHLSCNWDVVEGLFPDGLIQDMFEAYWALLQQLSTSSLAWSAPSVQNKLPPKQQVQRYITNTTVASLPEQLIHDLFVRQAQARGDNLAVITSQRRITYSMLFEEVNRLGHRLRRLGIGRHQLVAVVMEKGWEQVVAALAVLSAGAAYVPIDPDQPAERIDYLLKNSEVAIALTQSWLDARMTWPSSLQRICLDSEDLSTESTEPLTSIQTPDDLAYVLYTSGSTGYPKGVMLSHRGVVNAITATNQEFKINPQDRGLALTALHHDMSIFDVFGLLAAGAALVIPDAAARKDPGHWQALMHQEQVTIWNSVPAMMEMLLAYGQEIPAGEQSRPQLSSLRLAFLGGDWIATTLPARLKAIAPNTQVVSVGGPTETTLWSIWYPVETVEPSWKSIPYGKPIANTQYYVLNEHLEDCPTWVSGEICCSGIGLAKGYWKDPEKTQARFITHPRTGNRLYRTGDIGRYLPSGDIEFLGRADLQVKIQGQRIELGEIEAALQQVETVRSAVVVALQESNKTRLVAYVVPQRVPQIASQQIAPQVQKQADLEMSETVGATPVDLNLGSLGQALSQKLPAYMQPAAIISLKRLPLSANGKIDRKALLARAHEDIRPFDCKPVAPQNQLEKTLAAVWQDILVVEQVDITDNFFDLGGNSLLITQVYRQLSSVLPPLSFRQPTLLDLFKYSTIRDLAQYLSLDASTADSPIPLDLDESLSQRLNQGKNRLRQQQQRSTAKAGQ